MKTKTKSSKAKKHPRVKWQDELTLDIYEHAASGYRNRAIAKRIGVSPSVFRLWIKDKSVVRNALVRGRQKLQSKPTTFQDFIHGSMSPALQKLWKKLKQYENSNTNVSWILGDSNEEERQELFLHALYHCNFMPSIACRFVGIPNVSIQRWIKSDPIFAEMVRDIHVYKKDFFENALIDKVKEGDISAILFANRTINRDRGYHDKVEIDVNATLTHKVKVDDLQLSLEVRKQLLEAVRARQQLQLPAPATSTTAPESTTSTTAPEPVDAEFTVKEKKHAKKKK